MENERRLIMGKEGGWEIKCVNKRIKEREGKNEVMIFRS